MQLLTYELTTVSKAAGLKQSGATRAFFGKGSTGPRKGETFSTARVGGDEELEPSAVEPGFGISTALELAPRLRLRRMRGISSLSAGSASSTDAAEQTEMS